MGASAVHFSKVRHRSIGTEEAAQHSGAKGGEHTYIATGLCARGAEPGSGTGEDGGRQDGTGSSQMNEEVSRNLGGLRGIVMKERVGYYVTLARNDVGCWASTQGWE